MNVRRIFTRPRLVRAARIAGVVLAVYTVLGFLALPRIARAVAEKKLTELLHRQTTIGKVTLNPFTLALTVDDFSIRARDGGPFVAFKQLFVDVQGASVWKGGLVVRDIVLREPAITVTRETALTYSFSDLIEQFSGGPPPDPKARPTRYSLNNIRVVGGSLDFVDVPKQATHTVRSVELSVPFVSTLPYDLESYVQPSFSASVNGTAIDLHGRTKPFSETRDTSFDIDLTDLSIPKYMEYVPVALRCSVPSGTVDAKASLSFEQAEGKAPELSVTGKVSVKGLAVDDASKKRVVSLPLVEVTVGKTNVFAGRVKLDLVRVDKPDLVVARDAAGDVNLAALGPKPATTTAATTAEPAGEPGADAPFVFEVAEAAIDGGTVHFRDVAPGGAFATTLTGLHVGAKHFSTARGKPVAIEAHLTTEAGESVRDTAEITLSPLHVKTRVDVGGVVLKKYAPYYAPSVLVDLDEGKLDLGASVELRHGTKGGAAEVEVSDLGVTLSGVHVRKRGEKREIVTLESLEVKGATLDLARRSVSVASVAAKNGHVEVDRTAGGAINLASLTPPARPGGAGGAGAVEAAPWAFTLAKLTLDGWGIRFHDAVPEKGATLTLDPLALTVSDLNLAKGSRLTLDLKTRVNRGGSVTAAGAVVLDPLAVNLKVDAKAIDLLPLQPYFTDRINLLLTSGSVSAAGDLTLAATGRGTRSAYKGRAGIDKLVAVEKSTSEDFLKWDSLFLGGIDYASDPAALTIGEVSLSTFYSRLAVNADATLNLRQIAVATPSPADAKPAGDAAATQATPPSSGDPAPGPSAPASMPIRVDRVTLQGGTVDFADRLVKPNFSTSLKELGGRITGLSSDEASTADLDVKAKLEEYAPLEISGKVNPLSKELAVAIKVAFHDIDVSELSPYMGKYAGYTVSKGKLFLDLSYTIAKRKLEATNTVFIDQLTLGDSVNSPTATKLPVRLAIALLKDRKGEIHIDLPIKGSLDDPKFSVGGIILETLENLVVKAVTAPFALLGSLFGHGEDLSSVEFDDGRAALSQPGVDKLKTLVKALNDRPSLKMDLTGYVDPVRDAEGLRRLRFERKLKAQKLKDLTEQGAGAAASIDDVKLEPGEYAHYLELAYKAETFPKPRNVLGMAKDLPGPEMEKLILTHLTVVDDDLRALAQQRANEVNTQLQKAGIAEERVFAVEPKGLAPERKDALKSSRVDFVLR